MLQFTNAAKGKGYVDRLKPYWNAYHECTIPDVHILQEYFKQYKLMQYLFERKQNLAPYSTRSAQMILKEAKGRQAYKMESAFPPFGIVLPSTCRKPELT